MMDIIPISNFFNWGIHFVKYIFKCIKLQFLQILTLAGFAIAAKAESGAAAAGTGLVAVAQQADVWATSSLPKLIWRTCMAAH